ncbi:hypothetical protein QJS04_geneDACA012142 [Acorus gramineus]|uniref:Uncharacterized protein n=1 Tax=Acorus gramineus TaxID=55184 RepID=A0AAV9BCL2_ACOGR|nr:hypothetical protein QJS04_geneDACA012142 [Acorus gramineus]
MFKTPDFTEKAFREKLTVLRHYLDSVCARTLHDNDLTKTGEANGTCKDEIVSEIGKKMKEGHVLLKLQKTHNAH